MGLFKTDIFVLEITILEEKIHAKVILVAHSGGNIQQHNRYIKYVLSLNIIFRAIVGLQRLKNFIMKSYF